MWTYSAAGTQQAIVTLPSTTHLTGQGNWIWIETQTVTPTTVTENMLIYAIGSSTPTQTITDTSLDGPIPDGLQCAILTYGAPQVTVVDFSGSAPTSTVYATDPVGYADQFAANSASAWVVGNKYGVLLDGASSNSTRRFFGYGQAVSIAGAGNTAAIATASGQILIYDITGPTRKGVISSLAAKVALSDDAGTLAAADLGLFDQYRTDRTLSFYSLPAMTLTGSIGSSQNFSSTPFLADFTLSGSGSELGELMLTLNGSGSSSTTAQLVQSSGSGLVALGNGSQAPQLSPDGTLAALPTGVANGTVPSTNIYKNGTLVSAVNGEAEGWIDNNNLLAAVYTSGSHNQLQLTGSTIYNAAGIAGATLSPTQFPDMYQTQGSVPYYLEPQFFASGSVYDPKANAIYSLTTGTLTFAGPADSRGIGTVAGSDIVYESNHQVILVPFQ